VNALVRDEREARAEALAPLVQRIARKVARMIPSADLDDLVGDGYVGLMRAVDGFDPARGDDLERYATRVVTGAMINGVRKREPVSVRVRRAVREADEERFRIANEEGRLPGLSEIERRRPELRAPLLKAHRQRALSLSAPLPPGEAVAADAGDDPEELALAHASYAALSAAIHRLNDRLRLLVAMHYFHDCSMQDIAAKLNVTPQRVSQLHKAALSALRRELGG
jgi:RNA polymerase sigma factor FliA